METQTVNVPNYVDIKQERLDLVIGDDSQTVELNIPLLLTAPSSYWMTFFLDYSKH